MITLTPIQQGASPAQPAVNAPRPNADLLALLVNLSPDGLLACKLEAQASGRMTDLIVTLANASAARVLGHKGQDIRTKTLGELMPDLSRDMWRQLRFAIEHKMPLRIDAPLIRDSEQIWIRLSMEVQKSGVVIALTEVTDLVRMVNEFKYQAELSEAQAEHVVDIAAEVENARIALSAEVERREQLEAELRTIAMTDPLTGINNRRSFEDKFATLLPAARRYNQPFSVISLDIDKFKAVNDTYGHAAGDEVIKAIAHVMADEVRQDIDVAARLGGEEFVLLLPFTPIEGAAVVAERIRACIEKRPIQIDSERSLHVTASLGVSTLTAGDSAESLMERADTMLYQAKRTGRNKVCTDIEPEVPPVI